MPIVEYNGVKPIKCTICGNQIIYGAKYYSHKTLHNTICMQCYKSGKTHKYFKGGE